MKERWVMRRTANLNPGDVVWIGINFTLTNVKPRIHIHIKGKTDDGRGSMEAELPRDMYLPVLKTPVPPKMPIPPPIRYVSDHGNPAPAPKTPIPPALVYGKGYGVKSWWEDLKDWLNGR